MKQALAWGAVVAGIMLWAILFQTEEGNLSAFAHGPAWPGWVWWAQMISGYVFLVVGVVLGALCRGLIEEKKRGSERVNLRVFFRRSMVGVNLWLSLLGSPVLYGSILHTGGDLALGAFCFFALQTGFSSHIVLRTLLEKPPSVPKPSRLRERDPSR